MRTSRQPGVAGRGRIVAGLTRLAPLGVLGLLPGVLVVVPASGDPSGRCATGELCLFADNHMHGPLLRFTGDARSYADGGQATGAEGAAVADDGASSLVNDTDRWAVVYVDRGLRGHALCVAPGAFVDDLEAYGYDSYGHTFGDAVSSHELRATRPRPYDRGGPCDHVVTGDAVVGGGGGTPGPSAPAPLSPPPPERSCG
jgi:hypothetical protein